MKRFLTITAAATMTAACNGYHDMPQSEGQYVDIAIEATTAGQFTRATGDEIAADRCILEIYDADGNLYPNGRLTAAIDESGNFSFEPRLLAGETYDLVFWADKGADTDNADLHYDTSLGLRQITVRENTVAACNNDSEAFRASVKFTADRSKPLTATLTRATCRINVATGFTPAATGEYTVSTTFADAPVSFNALTGEIGGTGNVTSTATVTADGTPVAWYTNLLAPEEQGTVDFRMDITPRGGTTAEFSREFTDMPIQRNYRVNISVGTSAVTVKRTPVGESVIL